MNFRHFVMFFLFFSILEGSPPQLCLVIVIDQLSYQNLMKIRPFLTGGIAQLLDNGIIYHNALWPHAMPGTGPGHAGLSTGCVPSISGITDNRWIDNRGKKVYCDDDFSNKALVFSPRGFYDFGKSSNLLAVDTISDQIVLSSTPTHNPVVYSLALKSRAAIMMAGSLGKAIWFDNFSGNFTSSRAYFSEMPEFIKEFNIKHNQHQKDFSWKLLHNPQSPAYQFYNAKNYEYSREPSLINKITVNERQKNYYELFMQTPQSQALLLELAKQCLDQALEKENRGIICLWISLSAVDKVGHIYGPDSIDYLDILYHTDHQLKEFFKFTASKISLAETLIVFTADHGSVSIPELLRDQGLSKAQRINTEHLKDQLNDYLLQQFSEKDLIYYIDTPCIYFNRALFDNLSSTDKNVITAACKAWLARQPGIKQAWSYHELSSTKCMMNDELQFYKNQLFPGRSGDIIFQVYPYVYASDSSNGTGHKSPYNYDTHVPLVLYQPGKLESKSFYQKVWVQQVPATLGPLLQVPIPSACPYCPLPGIP